MERKILNHDQFSVLQALANAIDASLNLLRLVDASAADAADDLATQVQAVIDFNCSLSTFGMANNCGLSADWVDAAHEIGVYVCGPSHSIHVVIVESHENSEFGSAFEVVVRFAWPEEFGPVDVAAQGGLWELVDINDASAGVYDDLVVSHRIFDGEAAKHTAKRVLQFISITGASMPFERLHDWLLRHYLKLSLEANSGRPVCDVIAGVTSLRDQYGAKSYWDLVLEMDDFEFADLAAQFGYNLSME